MDCQSQELTTFLNLGLLPERTEAHSAHAWVTAPYGVYRTADGWMTVAQVPLATLGVALGNDRLQQLTAWDDGTTYRDEVYGIVESILPSRTTAAWLEIFAEHKLWGGPVYDYKALSEDPHVTSTGMIGCVTHPVHGAIRMPAPPLHLSATPATIRTPPPMLGEHTEAVLRELGYDDQRILSLRAGGAI